MGKLFDQIDSDDPALEAFAREYLGGKGLSAALDAAVAARRGAPAPYDEVQSAGEMHGKVTSALVAQIHGLRMQLESVSREAETTLRMLDGKMDEVARLQARQTIEDIRRMTRLPGGYGGPGDGGGGGGSGGDG
ncbi:hypothetical protein GE300_13960 [Rhodobacteraceae bacterium 2CG4]|uniref:Uncharacterized protein n=1 Tax=Halovulum marinum TaxID=2662447 RepID=A0A6L5Z2A9_9RHOB|nr:hypothetical protein [Halovulum marinum]MSU90706.1 hypothetical protein [Halovulum marinum]